MPTRRVPAEEDGRRINETARTIRDLHRASALQFACDVGRIVLERFYAGDLDALRERAPKDVSLRKLAQHPDMPFGPSALFQAIGIFELLERHGGVRTCKHLGPSHVRLLLGLPEPLQGKLLRRAERQRWTVAELQQEAASARKPKGKGGRPPLPAFVKTIRALQRYVEQPERYFGDVDEAGRLREQDVEELCRVVRQLRAHCEALEARLGR